MPNFLQNDWGVRESQADTAVPASGTYNIMDRVENSAPALATPEHWVCTSGGSPGTWVAAPPLQAVANRLSIAAASAVAVTDNIVYITGSGAHNITLAAPAAANNGTRISVVNTSSGTVTLVAGTGAGVIGTATIATLTGASLVSLTTNWYRV